MNNAMQSPAADLRQRVRHLLHAGSTAVPSRRARRGASAGAAIAVLAFTGTLGAYLKTSLGVAADVLIGVAIGLTLMGGVAVTVAAAWALVGLVPRLVGWTGTGALGALLVLFFARFDFPWSFAWAAVAAVAAAAMLGAAVSLGTSPALRTYSRPGKAVLAGAAALALAVHLSFLWWLGWPGTDAHLSAIPQDPAAVTPLDAPDPSRPGPFRVGQLTYGAGDRHRPEFGARADLMSHTVDARPLLRNLRGLHERLRRWYWGYGPEAFPLNGRIWFPEGEGPFPLVLIVHGNHQMADFSDPGYGYLAELLASRGFIAVSVDENFLNRSPIAAVPNENDARGWVLLEHLALWSEWNQTAGHLFAGRVDMENIALIGHSRGGEGVAAAAAFNRMSHYPDDATVRFDFGFSIKAVIAIAPGDGQYRPADKPLRLENINYFTIHGSHDSDVHSFLGDRMYGRIRFAGAGDWFKSTLYVHRANHGQFNTVWNDVDLWPPQRWTINLKPLLEGDEQRRIAKVYFTAFLEATLRNDRRYRALFRDHRRARHWLPDTAYLNRYADADFRVLCDFDEDVDVTTTTVPHGRIDGDALALWRERDVRFRGGARRGDNGVYLGWQRSGEGPAANTPTYTIWLPEGYSSAAGVSSEMRLVFDLARPNDEVSLPGASAPLPDRLDLTVELEDMHGVAVRLPLSHFRAIPPLLRARYNKAAAYERARYRSAAESIFQTFELPLSAFVAAEPRFAPAQLTAVRFRFDRTERGIVILDNIGFSTADDAAAGPRGAPPPRERTPGTH